MWTILILTACSTTTECDLDATAADLAGSGAVACGTAGAEAGEADHACAIEAWNAGSPFVLRSTTQGTDSVIERAVAFNGSTVWHLWQDQYGKGPWDVDGQECVDPAVET